MKLLFFANTDWYLFNFRLPLAEALRKLGHEVVLVSPPGNYAEILQRAGFRWIAFRFSRTGMNPLRETLTVLRLTRLYWREKPDLVHHFTIKCVLYGALAAGIVGVNKTVNAVTGLGHVFATDSLRNRVIRPIIAMLYRVALRNTQVIFQNPDDQRDFLSRGLVNRNNCHLIGGSGVNTKVFSLRAIARCTDVLVITMVARLLVEKGVREFVECAAMVVAQYPQARFYLAGDSDPGNPSSITTDQIRRWDPAGNVNLLGHVSNVAELLATSDIAVLPSYREGIPRSLLEAAACGLPLVATDTPGCREIVRHEQNGLLVPPFNSEAIAAALLRLAHDPALRSRMGARSREIAVNEFSEDRVIAETIAVYMARDGGQRSCSLK